jgi:protease IV
MFDDPCRNPSCKWRQACPLRPAIEVPGTSADPPINFPTEDTAGATFNLRLDRRPPYIGELHITGSLTEANVAEAIADAQAEMPGLGGLLIFSDSRGGAAYAGKQLEALIIEARHNGTPTVAYIRQAHSAALLPCLAADQTFIAPNGEMGGFGSLLPWCDGERPDVLVSKATPKKCTASWPPMMLITSDEARNQLQAMLDGEFESNLQWVARHSGCDVEQLRPLMDGRVLTAREALDAGLVTGVLPHEGLVYEILFNMAISAETNTTF